MRYDFYLDGCHRLLHRRALNQSMRATTALPTWQTLERIMTQGKIAWNRRMWLT